MNPALSTHFELKEQPSIEHEILNKLAIIYGQVELLQITDCRNIDKRLENTLAAAQGIKRLLISGDITGTVKKEYDKSFSLIFERIEYLKKKVFSKGAALVLNSLHTLCIIRKDVHKNVRLIKERICFNCLTETIRELKEGWFCTNCNKVWHCN